MATQWLRRAWLAAAGASALLLAACGGGSIDSPLSPERIVAFGDAMGDAGQNGRRYSVNDATGINWTEYVANAYGLTLDPVSAGGLSYAVGNARVRLEPDAAGSTATPTVKEQIDAFLATGSPRSEDLILVSAGTSDLIVQVQAVLAGTQTEDEMRANVEAAGRDLAAQVKRLLDAGATHVAVAGTYNLGRSPWAAQTGSASLLEDASSRFNSALLVAFVDAGVSDTVLYIDHALLFNNVTGDPSRYSLDNAETPVCTSVDPGPGIGTGANRVNSNLCTTSTLLAGADYTRYLFADRVYPTPQGHQLFGNFAYDKIREVW